MHICSGNVIGRNLSGWPSTSWPWHSRCKLNSRSKFKMSAQTHQVLLTIAKWHVSLFFADIQKSVLCSILIYHRMRNIYFTGFMNLNVTVDWYLLITKNRRQAAICTSISIYYARTTIDTPIKERRKARAVHAGPPWPTDNLNQGFRYWYYMVLVALSGLFKDLKILFSFVLVWTSRKK